MKNEKILQNNICTVIPYGRIDTNTASEFSAFLEDALADSTNIRIDFSETEYISSSGLRVLLQLGKKVRGSGSVCFAHVNDTVLDVFQMTGFDQIFFIEEEKEEKPDIRVLFFDIDGTLLSHRSGSVPQSTVEALKEAQKKGMKIVVATGRDIIEMKKLPIMHLNFDGYLTLNGNICLDKEEKMFAGNEIDPGEVEILVEIFKAKRLPFVLIGEKQRYINYVDDVVIETQHSTHGTIPDIGEYHGEKIYQCLAFLNQDVRRKLEDMLDHCQITSWNDTGIDIIAKSGGKAAGIQKFLDQEQLKKSQTMAFGDGENDMSMLQFAGIGVAMGNATEKLKQVADYVTTDIDNNGIANALRHFQLID